LRGTELLLCPGRIEVTIEEPIDPTQEEWRLLIEIRDQARTVISKYSGEEKL